MSTWFPVALGVYDEVQPATPIDPLATVQIAVEKVPAESDTKLTLPVGVITFPPFVSVMVTVQLEA